jgi:hypothetical protein
VLIICAAVVLFGLQVKLSPFDPSKPSADPNRVVKLWLDGENPKLHSLVCPALICLAVPLFVLSPPRKLWLVARPPRVNLRHAVLVALSRFLRPPPQVVLLAALN